MQQSSGDTAEPASLGSCNVNGWTDVGEARPTTEDSGIGQPTPITPAEWSVEREGSTNSVARPTETVHTERSQSPVSVIETQLEADTKSSPSPSNERPESNISFETVDNIDENATDCNSNEDHLNSNECDDENGPVIVVTEPAHEEESVFSADQPKPKYTKPFHIQRILSETDDELERKLTIRKRSLCIKPPDDDAMTTIQRRLDEISEMVTPRTEKGAQLLDELDEPLRAYVLELAKQSPSVFARHRRKEWKVGHVTALNNRETVNT
uniref:Uncharacterized protein LOC102806245 n=1 Tax=Saccoglossus kowalevskii TaxID=10224 RepID=A0ABM0MI65_SACKO|nr:PREDICTED: uncharacterized protein LOC102806245 [Saccoglossus kowalevskii]